MLARLLRRSTVTAVTVVAVVAVAAGQLAGCAQISTSTRVSTRPVPGVRPLSVERRVVERQIEARWLQRGDSLAVELIEHRRCQVVERVAAVREAQITRRADAAIYWEYGLTAALLGLAAFSFARPELFAVPEPMGSRETRDPKSGRRVGGVFAGLGALALGVSIYDSVRARDQVHRSQVVVLRPGPAVDCDAPSLPASSRRVELQLGEHRSQTSTDLEGRARFLLPGPEQWPAEPVADGMDGMDGMDGTPAAPQRRRWAGVLKVGQERGMAIEVVLPYAPTLRVPSGGAAMSLAH